MKEKDSFINKLTIVGGQPIHAHPQPSNTNIEKLFVKATTDVRLRKLLLQDKESVIENPEFSLSPQDKMILKNISTEKLEAMIDRFIRQKTSRRNFLKGAAAVIAVITNSMVLSSCKEESDVQDKNPTASPEPEPTDKPEPVNTPINTPVPVNTHTPGTGTVILEGNWPQYTPGQGCNLK
ncbi:twin-arginine translocation signal domain-containing protein [Candidatus Parcubacteria bacterium]|nr:MAG: twin-arginine translocation signal domain-containing protein [Candidatus Parcubacteria bacterium]